MKKALKNEKDAFDGSIAVLGLGHVGLPTALGLAELGWKVIGADEDAKKVSKTQAGIVPFYEPGLQELLSKHLASARFQVTTDIGSAVANAQVIFVCVGTPQGADGRADLSQVEAVTRVIAANIKSYKLIVEKSTVPAITARWMKRTIDRYAPGRATSRNNNQLSVAGADGNVDFDVASNPEFLQEGRAVDDFFHPTRIVLGVDNARARNILQTIYRSLDCPVLVTTLTTAELIKHTANAFLSTKISFINMVSDLCDALGADVIDVAQGLGLDPRIGVAFLQAGIGFGGYCFPKDLRALIYLSKQQHVESSLLEAVEEVNRKRIDVFLAKLRKALWVVRGKTVALLGLAFKPETDDIREAPSLKIVQALLEDGASLRLYDPQAMSNVQRLFPERPGQVHYCSSAYDATTGAHAMAILTEWEEFKHLDPERIRDQMEVRIVLDGRNILNPRAWRAANFEYYGMGRVLGDVENSYLSSRETAGFR